jgi:hypothetical protein
LHFYVVDLEKDEDGILSYTLGVRSLDGSGEQERGVDLEAPADGPDASAGGPVDAPNTPFVFTLRNTGAAGGLEPGLHPDEAREYLSHDVYRLTVSVDGEGWSARILNALTAVEVGGAEPVTVYVSHEETASLEATLTLRATSESDPSKTAATTVSLGAGDRTP